MDQCGAVLGECSLAGNVRDSKIKTVRDLIQLRRDAAATALGHDGHSRGGRLAALILDDAQNSKRVSVSAAVHHVDDAISQAPVLDSVLDGISGRALGRLKPLGKRLDSDLLFLVGERDRRGEFLLRHRPRRLWTAGGVDLEHRKRRLWFHFRGRRCYRSVGFRHFLDAGHFNLNVRSSARFQCVHVNDFNLALPCRFCKPSKVVGVSVGFRHRPRHFGVNFIGKPVSRQFLGVGDFRLFGSRARGEHGNVAGLDLLHGLDRPPPGGDLSDPVPKCSKRERSGGVEQRVRHASVRVLGLLIGCDRERAARGQHSGLRQACKATALLNPSGPARQKTGAERDRIDHV